MQQSMKIDVMMDENLFRDFVMFDHFQYRKIWKKPLLFAAVFTVFSLMCFAMRGIREQADLLGVVLLVIGLGLPLVYFGMFFRTVIGQVKNLKLAKPRLFYTVHMTPENILMTAKGAVDQSFPWEGVERAYRAKNAVYLYVAPGSALILPFQNAKGGADALWAFLADRLGENRLSAVK